MTFNFVAPMITLDPSHPINFPSAVFSDIADGKLKGFLTLLYGDDFDLDYMVYWKDAKGNLIIEFN